jgi:hypothetical protein
VDEKASNLSQYGLQTPALEVDAVNKNNKSQRLLFGDDTPTGSGVYATLAGDPRVFTIATYTKSSIDKSADDLQDKRLLTLNPEKISRIELITKNQTLEFGRAKDDWEIIKPRPLRADSSQIRDLLTKLTEARMDAAANDIRKTASAFSSGIRVATAKLTGDAGVQQLEIHKNKDDFYAKSSAVGGIYKVSSDIGQALEKKLDDFRSKKIFDLGFENPDKVEIRDGSKVYALRRNGEDWVSADGRKLDSSSVQPLLGDLRGLVASKFVDSVGAKPVIEMSVTSDDGKRVEKVQIAPSGTAYVAKREGDSTHYLVDSNSVADLQKAASNLKAGSFTKK